MPAPLKGLLLLEKKVKGSAGRAGPTPAPEPDDTSADMAAAGKAVRAALEGGDDVALARAIADCVSYSGSEDEDD